jgi:hypothetical protein
MGKGDGGMMTYGERRLCPLCNKPLSVYNPGPTCHACDHAMLPPFLQGLFDQIAELDKIRAQRREQLWQ